MDRAEQNDFSKGKVWRHILNLAVPLTVAQLVQICYSIVDRIYIGHLEAGDSLALTGLGLTFPVVTLISAFTNLFGMGGAPLCSIERGKRDLERAEQIMGNTLTMLAVTSAVLFLFFRGFMRPVLFAFGASEETWPYAQAYLRIYLLGTPFLVIGIGMNSFITAEGFGRTGMVTVLLGAAVNLVLDPVFIFLFHMGITGAAAATVIAQALSFLWVMRFLTGSRTLLRIRREYLRPEWPLVGQIVSLGTAGFMAQATSGIVQIACNSTLRSFGGDLYVGIMTVLNSVREVLSVGMLSLTQAASPVLGFNYGAEKPRRLFEGIRLVTVVSVFTLLLAWAAVFFFPEPIMSVFTSDRELIRQGVRCMHVYFFGFFFMAFQASGQITFTSLGLARHAAFFSTFRKLIIVVPLTLLLPRILSFGVMGVFLAEPVSNLLGGTACYVTMLFTMRRIFREKGWTVRDRKTAESG